MESQIKASGRFEKRTVMVAGALALLATAVVLPMFLSARGHAARIEISNTEPLTVRGSQFDDGEPVRLRVVTDQTTQVRRVKAGEKGTFEVRFEGTRVDRCTSGLVIEAVGTTGSRVSAKILPVACPLEL
jgi:hypothetical protein